MEGNGLSHPQHEHQVLTSWGRRQTLSCSYRNILLAKYKLVGLIKKHLSVSSSFVIGIVAFKLPYNIVSLMHIIK